MNRKRLVHDIVNKSLFLYNLSGKWVFPLQDVIDRLTACGLNLIDIYDAIDDYLYDDDADGLMDYVTSVEEEYMRRLEELP